MKVRCFVTVDDGDNYVTFHGLNVRIKIKTITKAQLDSVSNRELKRGLNRTAVLFFWFCRDVGFDGSIKFAKNGIMSAMECADETVLTFFPEKIISLQNKTAVRFKPRFSSRLLTLSNRAFVIVFIFMRTFRP